MFSFWVLVFSFVFVSVIFCNFRDYRCRMSLFGVVTTGAVVVRSLYRVKGRFNHV